MMGLKHFFGAAYHENRRANKAFKSGNKAKERYYHKAQDKRRSRPMFKKKSSGWW